MAEDTYLRLYRELNASRFDSADANEAIEQLGPPARVIRALARARRHAWTSAREDLRAAVSSPDVAPIIEFVAGVGLFVVRDYDLALTTLARAASRKKPGIAKQARMFALRFATALGWSEEARMLERELGKPDAAPAKLAAEPDLAAEQAWALVYERGPAAAEAVLDRLLAEHPDHPKLVGARVRLDLLCDRPGAAAERLARLGPELLEQLPGERAALALVRNDAKQAVVRTVHARENPRLLYLRALALLELDELDEASELLERARVAMPRSVSVGLQLALARHRQDPDTYGEGLERRFEDLLDWAPALLSDAAAELDLELWTDQGPVAERSTKVAILERAASLLTKEADVAHPSYRSRTSRIRHVPSSDDLRAPSQLRQLHADDRKLIDHVDGILVRALGIKPPRPEVVDNRPAIHTSPGQAWQPQLLTPEQIEQFLVDGFLVVREAFDPAISKAWREDANRRLREEPERWVRGYDPNDEARSLRNYTPDDPSTWTWGRVDLEGPETVVIEEFAPRAWATICDLLGGPDRIKTRTWNNYLIINFCADAHLGVDKPEPDWSSWHIDDPSPMTRLDRIQNGLVGIALHDRLLPASGNTWIAPDSVGRVARELAAHPEGVDFVANRGNRITMQCERFHEVVGEAGDLLLMHPLMMHSSAPNRSGRIRWMSNPMVYLNEPLDPFRANAELSVVELAIHRAIANP